MTAVLTPITSPRRVDERPPGVAGVERRVRLDDVLDHAACARLQRAAERGDDAGRDRRIEAERVADRDGDLAAPQPRTVAQARACDLNVGVDAQEREIGVGIVAERARIERPPVQGGHANRARALDDMAVGQQQSIWRNDEAGPGARRLAVAAHVDPEHGGPDAVDDIGDGLAIGIKQDGFRRRRDDAWIMRRWVGVQDACEGRDV